MQVVMLYGPPGVGKLTTAKELAALTGHKVLHNHLTVDLVTALFPRDSEPWFRLLRQVRQDVYDLIHEGQAARLELGGRNPPIFHTETVLWSACHGH